MHTAPHLLCNQNSSCSSISNGKTSTAASAVSSSASSSSTFNPSMLTQEEVLEDLAQNFTTSIRVSADPTVFDPTLSTPQTENNTGDGVPPTVIAELDDTAAEPAVLVVAELDDTTAEPASAAAASATITTPVNVPARVERATVRGGQRGRRSSRRGRRSSAVVEASETIITPVNVGGGRGRGRLRRRSRRRMPTPAGSRKRSAADIADAEAEILSCQKHKHRKKYARRLQLMRQDIVQDLMDNDGGQFLKDVDPDNPEPGWELSKHLDIFAIEQDQRKFFRLFTLFLGGLKHHQLRNEDGSLQAALHEKIKRHCTAVNGCWKRAYRPIPYQYTALIAEFLSNKRKKEKQMKADGDIDVDNSREAMSFELYRALAWFFLVTGNIFSHVFLLFCWNMMVRNCNCDQLNFAHVMWVQDALAILVPSTKTNKDGKRDAEQLVDKHIYANMYMPEICPILGLAMYLLVNPQVGTRKSKKFFPGTDTHVRFNTDIAKAIETPSFKRYLVNRGIHFHKIGAYSTRKGSSTYCTSGVTSGPSVVVVCQRAGWSMGPTLERYLKNGQAGDQFCGRVVAGLPQLTWKFAALPPHFKDVGAGDAWDQILTALRLAFPYAERWGPQFAPVCIFMLASLTHHYDWICSKLSVEHPVRQTRLFQGQLLQRLKPYLATGKDVRLRPTGIPPWCVCFMIMQEINKNVTGLRDDFKSLPTTIKDCIRQSFNERDMVNGTASVSVVRQLLQEHTNSISDMLESRLQAITARGPIPQENTTTTSSTAPRDSYGLWFWRHDSGPPKYRELRYRYLPKNFRLCYNLKDKRRKEVNVPELNPTITKKVITVLHAWNLWFFGLQYGDKLIRPLYKLAKDPKFHFSLDNTRKRYSDIKALMKGMLHLLQLNGISLTNKTSQEIQDLFPTAFELMEKYIQENHTGNWSNKTYKDTCTCTTMKKHYYEAKKNAERSV